ncbi:hypothetical protein [Mycobacterium intracellulare]|uniref:hypothetical protein n=1 Tax=Mycobacterium intracellulare TaxID=1767 RepID=UPI000CE330FD|nr:hypothetical protein [Mycobacterium intracellulare]
MTLATNWVDKIGMFVNAAYLNQVGTEVNANTKVRFQAGTYSSLPAAGNVGAWFLCTDHRLLLRDNGTTWDRFNGSLDRLYDPPSSGLTTTTLGTATFAADKGDRLLTIPSVTGANWRAEYKSLSPTSNYTVEACIDAVFSANNNPNVGIVLRDSASGKMLHFGVSYNNAFIISMWQWNSATSWNAATLSGTPSFWPNWFRVRDDGTNRYYECSQNRSEWFTALVHPRTTFIIPDQVGWGGDNEGLGATILARLRSFRVS